VQVPVKPDIYLPILEEMESLGIRFIDKTKQI